MRKAVQIPNTPSHRHHRRSGRSIGYALTGPLCALRPITNSVSIIIIPIRKTNSRYTIINAPPPYCPVIYGNRHILPNPTDEPTAAIIAPNEELKPRVSLIVIYIIIQLSLLFLNGTLYTYCILSGFCWMNSLHEVFLLWRFFFTISCCRTSANGLFCSIKHV